MSGGPSELWIGEDLRLREHDNVAGVHTVHDIDLRVWSALSKCLDKTSRLPYILQCENQHQRVQDEQAAVEK